jgi:hypothetical protein
MLCSNCMNKLSFCETFSQGSRRTLKRWKWSKFNLVQILHDKLCRRYKSLESSIYHFFDNRRPPLPQCYHRRNKPKPNSHCPVRTIYLTFLQEETYAKLIQTYFWIERTRFKSLGHKKLKNEMASSFDAFGKSWGTPSVTVFGYPRAVNIWVLKWSRNSH